MRHQTRPHRLPVFAALLLLVVSCSGSTPQAALLAPEKFPGGCEKGTCELEPGAGPNEPAGHVQIFSTDGTSKNFAAGNYGKAWGDPLDPFQPIQTVKAQPGFNTVHVVADAGTPSGSAIEFVYAQGKQDGFAGAAFFNRWPAGLTYQNLYVRLLYQMDPAWTHHVSGTSKIMYLGYGGGGSPTQFYLSNKNGRVQLVDQTGSGHNPIYQAADITMEPGVWYEIEMIIYGQSSLEAADGGMEMWIDGRRVQQWEQRNGGEPQNPPTTRIWQFADGSRDAVHTRFYGAQLGGWFGGSPKNEPGKPQDEWLRWGALYISGLP